MSVFSNDLAIIPRPINVVRRPGKFLLEPDTLIVSDSASHRTAELLQLWLAPATGYELPITTEAVSDNAISLIIDPKVSSSCDEGYHLSVSEQLISVRASTQRGLCWGVQTLRQLMPPQVFALDRQDIRWEIPCVEINDQPRFRWRGMLLDTARHYMPVEFLYKWIDLLSLHKINTFQWHITDDQGWRIEIKKYPRLTEVGSVRSETLVGINTEENHTYDGKPHRGFYIQAEVRSVVRYAADRGVTIIPEIDVPGHSQAAIAAYPELGSSGKPVDVWTRWGVSPEILNPSEHTIRFYKDVLDEVLDLFPSKEIAVGGDEAEKQQWKDNPAIQQQMHALGIDNEEALQTWFMRQMNDYLYARGRRMVGWDELLHPDLPKRSIIISWRSEQGGIDGARAGHDVVMSPHEHLYFNYHQAAELHEQMLAATWCVLPLEKVYDFEPVPGELSSADAVHVLGAQGAVWAEYVPNPQTVEFMAFPRVCALSERLWSPKQTLDFEDFTGRLRTHAARLQAGRVNLCPLMK